MLKVASKFTHYVLALFSALTNFAYSVEFEVGLGPNYSQVTLNGSDGTSIFNGSGMHSEARLSFSAGKKKIPIGFDMFGLYGVGFLKNSNRATGESVKADTFGGGADFTFHKLFVGGQFENIFMRLSQAGSSTRLNYNIYGPRVGFNFGLAKSWKIAINGAYLTGDAYILSNNVIRDRTHSEYRGTFFISWRIGGSDFRSSKY